MQLRSRKGSKLEQAFPRALHGAQLLDARAQRLPCGGRFISRTPCPVQSLRLAPFAFRGHAQSGEILPRWQTLGACAQRADMRQAAGLQTQRRRQPLTREGHLIATDVGETCGYASAEPSRLVRKHVREPMPALIQHPLQQLLNLAPVVVESFKQQPGIGAERLVTLGLEQRPSSRAPIQFVRPLRDHQRTARPSGHRQLAGQAEIERVDGLDSQPARICGEVPAADRGMLQGGCGEQAQLLAVRMA